MLVAALDEEPLRLRATARALQREPATKLLSTQDEDRVPAFERGRPGDAAPLFVDTAVPDDHMGAQVLVAREPVVLDLQREALDGGVHRRPLRHRPRAHDAIDLEAQVE